jgi:excisionase family DNA binding protein
MSSKIVVNRICEYCKKSFEAQTTKTRYCSHLCNQKNYKLLSKKKKIADSEVTTKLNNKSFVEDINLKDFLTVKETSLLLNMSCKTIYRLIQHNELNAYNFAARKTLIRRKDIERYFDSNLSNIDENNDYLKNEINLNNSYTINEAIEKFNISNGALYNIIERFKIPKRKYGKYTLVKKEDLNIIFQ